MSVNDWIFLVETSAVRLADRVEFPLYLAKPGTVKFPHACYLGQVAELPRLTRQADSSTEPRRVPVWGELRLAFTPESRPDRDNSISWSQILSPEFNLLHRPLTIKAGLRGEAYEAFGTIFQGRISDLGPWSNGGVSLTLRDKTKEFEQVASDYSFPESPLVLEEAYGTEVGLVLGYCRNVTPQLFAISSFYGPPWFPPFVLPAAPYQNRWVLSAGLINQVVQVYYKGAPAAPGLFTFVRADVSPAIKNGQGTAEMIAYGPYTGALSAAEWLVVIDSITAHNSRGESGPEVGLAWFRYSLNNGATWSAYLLTWKLGYNSATLVKNPAAGAGVMAVSGDYTGDCKLNYKVKITRAGDIGDAIPPQFIWSDDNGATWKPLNSYTWTPIAFALGVSSVVAYNLGDSVLWEITTGGNVGGTVRFKWSRDGGATWTTDVSIPDTSPIVLFSGFSVQFADPPPQSIPFVPTIVPTWIPGAELVINGGFSADSDWTKGINWTISGGLLHAAAVAQYSSTYTNTNIVTVGQWFVYSFIHSNSDGKSINLQEGGNTTIRASSANGTKTGTFCSVTGGVLRIKAISALLTSNFDEVSLKAFSISDLVALRYYAQQVDISVAATIPANYQGGVITRWSDANNYLHGWYDRNSGKVQLDKVVAGVRTALIPPTTAAYGAGRVIEIRFSASNTAQLWYNGVQIGADQNVSAVPAGTWAGLFSSDASVGLTNPIVSGLYDYNAGDAGESSSAVDIPAVENTPVALNRGLSAAFSGSGVWYDDPQWVPAVAALGVMSIAFCDPEYDPALLEVDITVGGNVGGDVRWRWRYDGGAYTAGLEIPDTNPIELFPGLSVQFTSPGGPADEYDAGDKWTNIPYYIPAFVVNDAWAWTFKEIPIPLEDGVSVQFSKGDRVDPAFALGDDFRFILMSTLNANFTWENGDLSCDLEGLISPLTDAYVDRPGALIAALLAAKSGWTGADISLPSIAAFDLAFPYKMGWVAKNGATVGDIINDLLAGFPAFYTMQLDDKFYLFELTPPAGAPEILLTDRDLLEWESQQLAGDLVWRVFLNYGRNWTVSQNFIESAPLERQAWLRQEWRQVSSRERTILADYPWAVDQKPIDTAVVERADAQALSDKYLAIFGVRRELHRYEVKDPRLFTSELGIPAQVQRPRFGLDGGALFRLMGLDIDLAARAAMDLWR